MARAGAEIAAILLSALAFVGRHRAGFALVVVGGLAVTVFAYPRDLALLETIQSPDPGLGALAERISWAGRFENSTLGLAVALAAAALLTGSRSVRTAAVACLLAGIVAGLVVLGLRPVLGRARPDSGAAAGLHWFESERRLQSLPSGHAMTNMASALAVVPLVPAVGVPATGFALAVGWSRLQLNRHHPTDVLWGALLGGIIGLAIGSAARDRRRAETPRAGSPRARRVAVLFLVPSLFGPVTATRAQDAASSWSRFRGPNGSGVAVTSALPVEVGRDRNVAWKTPLPPGYSSPVLGASRVFVTALEDERLFTIALDRATGRELWRAEAPRPRRERLDSRNNPAAPSPATDGQRVYVFFGDFGLLAYDLQGTELWRRPLGPFDNLYGMGASPVVYDGRVFLVCDQRTGSFLLAVDAADGSTAWRVERPEAASSHATPILWTTPAGDTQLLVVGSFLFSGYSVESGERIWWVRGMIHEMKSVPVIDDQVAYVNGYGSPLNDPGNTLDVGSFDDALAAYDADGDGQLVREELPAGERPHRRFNMSDLDRDGLLGRRDWEYFRNSMSMTNGMFAIRLGGRGDMTARNLLWTYSRAVPQLPSPILYGGYLYMIDDGGVVTILDPATGERLDQGRIPGAVDNFYASPVAADGKIYLLSELGKLAVLNPTRQLELLALSDLDDLAYGTPAIADGRIYLRTREMLYCFARPDAPDDQSSGDRTVEAAATRSTG